MHQKFKFKTSDAFNFIQMLDSVGFSKIMFFTALLINSYLKRFFKKSNTDDFS